MVDERNTMTADAQNATDKGKSMILLQGLKVYPKAIGWSVLFLTAIVMEGYDVVLMASFFAFPMFREKYGDLQPNGSYELSASWQAGPWHAPRRIPDAQCHLCG